ncbi:hypothetical protein NQZ68_018181 [Dissostichus eleginoides]|nr:hypothetical protein NQZ68_018181 [Dissostichus eleginoides]
MKGADRGHDLLGSRLSMRSTIRPFVLYLATPYTERAAAEPAWRSTVRLFVLYLATPDTEGGAAEPNCSSSPEHGLQKVTNMADAAGSETGTETRSIKEEKDADPTTGTETRSIKKEKDADPTVSKL